MKWMYDELTGTFKSSEMTEALRARAEAPGEATEFGSVKTTLYGMAAVTDDSAAQRKLIEQLRWLRDKVNVNDLELRLCVGDDFGRNQYVCWYSPELDQKLLRPEVRIAELRKELNTSVFLT